MKAFLWKAKGYLIHYGLSAVIFLDPSVHAWLAAHPGYSAIGLLVWGTILHVANGKLAKS